jgi:hypothetical protein
VSERLKMRKTHTERQYIKYLTETACFVCVRVRERERERER